MTEKLKGVPFFYKAFIPFISFLAVLGPAPYCLRFGRTLPVFLIYGISLFVFVSFFTIARASIIIGESQVLPPLIAMGTIPLVFFLSIGWKYAKL